MYLDPEMKRPQMETHCTYLQKGSHQVYINLSVFIEFRK